MLSLMVIKGYMFHVNEVDIILGPSIVKSEINFVKLRVKLTFVGLNPAQSLIFSGLCSSSVMAALAL